MNNKLVKISLLLIAVLMVFCLFACNQPQEPAVEKVTVTFDPGKGDFADEDFSGSMEIEKNTAISEYPEVVRKGYILAGWYFDEDFEDECDSSHEFGENTTLYADWEKAPTYTVSFNTSRAGDGKTVEAQAVMHGGKVQDPGYTPAKKGLVFYGWCVDADKSKVWDFENDVVTSDIVIWAVFEKEGSGDSGDTSACEHEFEVTEYVAPTCESNGKLVQKCTKCKTVERYNQTNNDDLKKLPHLELEERVEPTCAVDGYSKMYCPNGCGLSKTTTLRATGKHQYDDLNWKAVVKPTKYVNGKFQNPCVVCGGAPQEKLSPYNAVKQDLDLPDISFMYTGGSYENVKLVNVATLGKVLVSSYFDGTSGSNAIDGNINTFWNADTYADGANYANDWIELELARAYDVGAISFTLPNYEQWALGEDCYISFDIEYWDEDTQSWVFITEISDKEAVSVGLKCKFMIELDVPVTTNKIKASVTHASRYAPAAIYEVEAYAKAEDTERLPMSISAQANVTISGKYNEWVKGADALTDMTDTTFWTTDARYNPNPWVLYEFPSETYIACIQFSTKINQGRRFHLEICKNGEWSTVGNYVVPKEGGTGEGVASADNGICVFNIDLEDTISAFKLTITNEPTYWESYVYDVTPYTVVEQAKGEPVATGCKHQNPKKGQVIAPSCDSIGYTEMNCVCGAIIRTNATDMTGHDFGKYTINTPATATTLGTKVATCRNDSCGAISTVNYAENYESPIITPYLHNAPAAWAQTFDDGNYLDTYTWANEYYIKYGIRATVMMSITYSDALVSVWKEHFTRGVFDLGSHSYNHTTDYAGDLSTVTLLHEVIDAQIWFRSNFSGQKVLTFAAPLGATSTGVADYLAGVLAANRNGGDTGIFYNTIDQLTNREVWGDLNSYISKSDQTEGEYVFVSKNGKTIYVKNADGVYEVAESYKHEGVNYVFDFDVMDFVDVGYDYAGTYHYIENEYKYEYVEVGSYSFDGTSFNFQNNDNGDYKMVKATLGSYEKGVKKLYDVGGFTVECLHSLGAGSIYSSYASTISKLEHITRYGIWGASYNELIQYLKESQSAQVETVERTETSITISVTDTLDDYMFNHALTVKVDIPDSWTSVTATQNGKEIPLVEMSYYSHTKNMSYVSCAIEDGFLYIDVIPDAGDVVITMGEKNDAPDYKETVTVTFNPGEGELKSSEYEKRVEIGQLASETEMPTPVREGYKFLGWDYIEGYEFTEDVTLNAVWEEIPKCTDGSYNHNWTNWLPSTEVTDGETRTCKDCGHMESREVIKPEE